jgi:hypothetical protein
MQEKEDDDGCIVVVPVVRFSVAPLQDGVVGDEVSPMYLFLQKRIEVLLI